MHQSVWLLAQNPATHPHTITHTQTCQGGKEAAKKGKREVSCKGKKRTKGEERREGGGHLVLSVHTHTRITLTGEMRESSQTTVDRSRSRALSEDLMLLLPAAHIHCNNAEGASGH